MRALVGVVDGEVQAVIGIAKRGDHWMLFADYREAYRPLMRRMASLRAIRTVLSWVEARTAPVFAMANPGEPLAPAILKRMGFELVAKNETGDVYRWS